MAIVIVASPKKSVHSSKPLLDVIITDVFSVIAEMNPKKTDWLLPELND